MSSVDEFMRSLGLDEGPPKRGIHDAPKPIPDNLRTEGAKDERITVRLSVQEVARIRQMAGHLLPELFKSNTSAVIRHALDYALWYMERAVQEQDPDTERAIAQARRRALIEQENARDEAIAHELDLHRQSIKNALTKLDRERYETALDRLAEVIQESVAHNMWTAAEAADFQRLHAQGVASGANARWRDRGHLPLTTEQQDAIAEAEWAARMAYEPTEWER